MRFFSTQELVFHHGINMKTCTRWVWCRYYSREDTIPLINSSSAATIWGQILFDVRVLFEEIRYVLISMYMHVQMEHVHMWKLCMCMYMHSTHIVTAPCTYVHTYIGLLITWIIHTHWQVVGSYYYYKEKCAQVPYERILHRKYLRSHSNQLTIHVHVHVYVISGNANQAS